MDNMACTSATNVRLAVLVRTPGEVQAVASADLDETTRIGLGVKVTGLPRIMTLRL